MSPRARSTTPGRATSTWCRRGVPGACGSALSGTRPGAADHGRDRLAVPRPAHCWGGSWASQDARDVPWVMEPRGAASRHWAEQACRQAGFEPDVRYETADLQAHIALIESGNAVALIPDLMRVRRPPNVRLVPLPDGPRRTIFTAARRASESGPAVRACRAALGEAVEAGRAALSGAPRRRVREAAVSGKRRPRLPAYRRAAPAPRPARRPPQQRPGAPRRCNCRGCP